MLKIPQRSTEFVRILLHASWDAFPAILTLNPLHSGRLVTSAEQQREHSLLAAFQIAYFFSFYFKFSAKDWPRGPKLNGRGAKMNETKPLLLIYVKFLQHQVQMLAMKNAGFQRDQLLLTGGQNGRLWRTSVSYSDREDFKKQPEIKLRFILSFNKCSIFHAARGG